MRDLHSAERMVTQAYTRTLTPAQQQEIALRLVLHAEGALTWLLMWRPTLRTVLKVRDSLEKTLPHLNALALEGDAEHARYAFRAAHVWLSTAADRWHQTSAEGQAQGIAWAVKALRDARAASQRWRAVAELAHGRDVARLQMERD